MDLAQTLIEELKTLITTLDGQLAAMRWFAQKPYRPKSAKVPEGQLALDLLGFMLGARTKPPSEPENPGASETPANTPKRPSRERRTSEVLHV